MRTKKKTKQELAKAFYLNQAEINRLFEVGYRTAKEVFNRAKATDQMRLGANYCYSTKVRLTTVLEILGVTEEELQKKVGD